MLSLASPELLQHPRPGFPVSKSEDPGSGCNRRLLSFGLRMECHTLKILALLGSLVFQGFPMVEGCTGTSILIASKARGRKCCRRLVRTRKADMGRPRAAAAGEPGTHSGPGDAGGP